VQGLGEFDGFVLAGHHASALERDEPVEAELLELVQRRLDTRARVDGDRHQRQVLRERQEAVGVQVLLGPEALDAAHDQAGLELVARVDLDERVGQEAAADAVALAEVGGELDAVLVHGVAVETKAAAGEISVPRAPARSSSCSVTRVVLR
jgi:hypothetical protein